MHNRHILSVCTSMAAVSTEFAWAKGRHKSSCAIQATVPISGIACNQLVGVAAEVDAGFADEIEEGEFVVCVGCVSMSGDCLTIRMWVLWDMYLLARRRLC
jgi:hypothetical protein